MLNQFARLVAHVVFKHVFVMFVCSHPMGVFWRVFVLKPALSSFVWLLRTRVRSPIRFGSANELAQPALFVRRCDWALGLFNLLWFGSCMALFFVWFPSLLAFRGSCCSRRAFDEPTMKIRFPCLSGFSALQSGVPTCCLLFLVVGGIGAICFRHWPFLNPHNNGSSWIRFPAPPSPTANTS